LSAREGRDVAIERRLATAKATTVKEAFEQYFATKGETLRNPKQRAQWGTTLETYAFPTIGGMPVGDVTTGDIIKILKPIWVGKAETANRVLQRLKAVFDYAFTHGWCASDPCRGVVQALGGTGHRDVEHHRGLPYQEVPQFLRALRMCNSNPVTKAAFEFLIFTATRSKETRLASWGEIDAENARWVIPKERMKMKVEHVVPLSSRPLEILRQLKADSAKALIFPGQLRGRPLSDMTLTKVLRDLGFANRATAHGFRSSFRTWAAETNQCRREVAEACLAHTVKNKVEAAYLRALYLEERKGLMQAWSNHCSRLD